MGAMIRTALTWRAQYNELRKTGTIAYITGTTWSDEAVAQGLRDRSLKRDMRLCGILRRLETE